VTGRACLNTKHCIAILALAAGLGLLVAMWAAPPPLAFTDRWVPLLKRDEAALFVGE
jgi:hypothetical protein